MTAAAAMPDVRAAVRGAAPGLLGLFVAVAALGWLVREPATRLGERFVDAWGLPGVFFGATLLDMLPGVGPPPVLLLGWTGGIPAGALLLAASLGGVAGAGLGWAIGRGLSRLEVAGRLVDRVGLGPIVRRFGWRAVLAAAVVPAPFALTTITAGVVGLPLHLTLLGALGRTPKALFNLLLIGAGWELAG